MSKYEWLNEECFFDDNGNRTEPIVDKMSGHLHVGTRREMLERRGLNIVEVDTLYKESLYANVDG